MLEEVVFERICKCKDMSVLEEVVFDVVDVSGLLDMLDNRNTLSHDGFPSIL